MSRSRTGATGAAWTPRPPGPYIVITMGKKNKR